MTRLLAKASAFMLIMLGAITAQAGPMYVFVVQDPATTAGAGVAPANGLNVTSTRSGPGTWHLYAVDDGLTTFGIRNYSVTLAGHTAINHRSPNTGYTDTNTDSQNAGFNDLRSGTNVNPIVAGQGLTNATIITGFGQTAGDFIAKIADEDTLSGTTSGQWGTYGDGVYGVPVASQAPVLNGPGASGQPRSAVLLAEGLGVANVVAASVSLWTNSQGTTSAFATQYALNTNPFIPEPATISLVGLALLGGLGYVRRRR
jgi:hypothetical protein